MFYMLDTNICIHLIKADSPAVAARFQRTRVGEIVMSVLTHAELSHGVERYSGQLRAQAENSLSQLVMRIPVLSFDTHASAVYGVITAAVRDRRRNSLDRLIAAHAIAVGAALVTNNEADFRDYPGLQLENWVQAA